MRKRLAVVTLLCCGCLTLAEPAGADITQVPGSPFSNAQGGPPVFSPAGGLLAEVAGTAGSPAVATFSVNEATGALTPVAGSPFTTGINESVVSLAFSPNGRLVATANRDFTGSQAGTISLFSVNGATGALTSVTGSPFPSDAGPAQPGGLAFSPDGTLLAVGNTDHKVSVYRVNGTTGGLSSVGGSPFAGGGDTVAFSPTGGLIAGASANGIAMSKVNPDGSLTPVPGSPFTTPHSPNGVAFSPDGRFVATGQGGGFASPSVAVFMVDSSTGQLTQISGSPFPSDAGAPAYSPNGRLLIVGADPIGVLAANPSAGVLAPVAGSPFLTGFDYCRGAAFSSTGGLTAVSGCSGTEVFSVTSAIARGSLSGVEGTAPSGTLTSDNCAVPGAGATIDWGDGTPSTATTVDGTGAIQAGHTFGEEGTYHGTVSLSDACGGTGTTFTATIADSPLGASAAVLNATAGVELRGQVGSFADADPAGKPGDYTATIDWGDGQSSAGTVQPAPAGGLAIVGDHTYLRHGSYPVTVTVIDAGGSSSIAQATADVAVNPLPPPELGKTVNALPSTGTVLVQPKKGQGLVQLAEPRQLPVGAQIDTRSGTVTLVTATTRQQVTQTARFGGALFKVDQSRNLLQKGLATLTVIGSSYARCTAHPAVENPFAPSATAALSSTVLQTLHAHDNHGRFRTRGRYSAATVRGTEWDTIDRCDGTLTVVRIGTVDVFDYTTRKTVTIHAGQRYVAKAPRKK
jgi:sugar lactone lactonase YvrE